MVGSTSSLVAVGACPHAGQGENARGAGRVPGEGEKGKGEKGEKGKRGKREKGKRGKRERG
jgi:hypothetical protein